ncbi:MAG: tetratricopeptide repeat protein [Acidobacteriota bacterium]
MTFKRLGKISSASVLAGLLALAGIAHSQEKLNNDYFAPDRDNSALATVERYHLAPGTDFWKMFRAREYHYAIQDMYFVLRYFPNHPKALTLLGSLARLMKQPSLPISHFQKAITLFPQHAITHAQFGNYLAAIDQVDPAIEQLKEAVQLDPKLAVAYGWLAEAYAKKGEAELAREAAEQARQLGYRKPASVPEQQTEALEKREDAKPK